MPIFFELNCVPNLPLDVRGLNPERIAGWSLDQIRHAKIGVGNGTASVSQWFDVSGEPDADADAGKVIFSGPLSRVHGIGHSLQSGTIEVHGSAGRHVGASASGGEIVVRGDAGDFAGYEMQGGTLVIHGDAGDHVGGCFPGAKFGMNRGSILIGGRAGKGLGYRMRRGTIVVGGDAGELTGWQMRAGTIMVFGGCDGPPGIDMKRGTIFVSNLQETPKSFSRGPTSTTSIVSMLQDWLRGFAARYEIEFPEPCGRGLQTWHGDQLTGSRGELFTFCS